LIASGDEPGPSGSPGSSRRCARGTRQTAHPGTWEAVSANVSADSLQCGPSTRGTSDHARFRRRTREAAGATVSTQHQSILMHHRFCHRGCATNSAEKCRRDGGINPDFLKRRLTSWTWIGGVDSAADCCDQNQSAYLPQPAPHSKLLVHVSFLQNPSRGAAMAAKAVMMTPGFLGRVGYPVNGKTPF